MNDARFFAACGTLSVLAVCAAAAWHRPVQVRVVTVPAPSARPVVAGRACAEPPAVPAPPAAHTPTPAPAVLLDDRFDRENGGTPVLMYGEFAEWTVEGGTVDLIGKGSDWDFLPGHGLYVDLDGDRPDGVHFEAGALVSRRRFLLRPGTYELSFRLAGSQRGDENTTSVSLGGVFSEAITLPAEAGFKAIRRRIRVARPAEARLRFENQGADGFGLLLDDVRLVRVE